MTRIAGDIDEFRDFNFHKHRSANRAPRILENHEFTGNIEKFRDFSLFINAGVLVE